MKKGVVTLDFATRRFGLRLFQLPGSRVPPFVKADRSPMPTANPLPDPAALKVVLDREYTGYTLPAMVKAEAR